MRALRIVLGVAVASAACTTFNESTPPSETNDGGTGTDGATDAASDAATNDIEDGGSDATQGTSSDYGAAVLADGPQAYWRMADAVGSTKAKDEIAGNDALLSNPAKPIFGNPGLFPGVGSLTFDGQSYRYALVSSPLPIDDTLLTLEAWIRLENSADSEYRHIAFAGSNTLNYGIYVHSDAGIGVSRITSVPSAAKTFRQTNIAPSTKVWHHVVATWNGAALTLYVDDEIATNGTTQAGGSVAVSPLYMGAKSPGDPSLPNGARLAEVAVYASALPPDRVHAHYVLGKP